MNKRIFRKIAELIVERNKITIESEEIFYNHDSIYDIYLQMYKDIYTSLLVLDTFIANILEHHPLEVDEIVYTTFHNYIDDIEDLLIFIRDEEDNEGHEVEVLGMNIALYFMNEEDEFSEQSLLEHMLYITQYFFLIRAFCDNNPIINYTEEEMNNALDVYNVIKDNYVEDNHIAHNYTTKSLFVSAITTYLAQSNESYNDACKAALYIALHKESIACRLNIENVNINVGSDAASAVIDNKHQLHTIIEFYSNEPVLLDSTAIQIISLLRSKYENFITDTHNMNLSDICTLLEIMIAIVDYISTVDSMLIDNLRNSLSHSNEYEILCQYISALQNR
jgi:hypothetical protein